MLIDSFIVVALIFIIGGYEYLSYTEQKDEWNNGISPIGKKWKLVNSSLPDTRVYEDGCGNQCIININFNIER